MSPAPYKDLSKDTVHTHPPIHESERREEHGWGSLKKEPLMEDQAEQDAKADLSKDKKEVKEEASRPPPSVSLRSSSDDYTFFYVILSNDVYLCTMIWLYE